MTLDDLKTMRSWDLSRKIQVTQARIMEWYQHYDGQVYVCFSGGIDSTVLLDIARRIYPDMLAVFNDTGLEYPEVREFALSKENVIATKPKLSFRKVLEKYGYPVISKEVSELLYYGKKFLETGTTGKWAYDILTNVRYNQAGGGISLR